MIQSQSPIGKFIFLAYEEPNFINNSSLREKVENLVDLIKIKTQTRGIEDASKSLQNELFEIRIECLNLLLEKPDLLVLYEKRILEEITNKFYVTGVHNKLGQTIADALEIYFKIFSHFSEIISNKIPANSLKINEIPSLNGLKNLHLLQPSKDVENYITWLEASLNFDYALIVSDLIFKNRIHIKQHQVQQLELLIKKSIVDFGSYSIVTNLWHPDLEDESQLMRNIKIKAAIVEIENGRTISIPSEALYQFISA